MTISCINRVVLQYVINCHIPWLPPLVWILMISIVRLQLHDSSCQCHCDKFDHVKMHI